MPAGVFTDEAGGDHAGADLGGGLVAALGGDVLELDLGRLDVQVNALEQRARDAAEVVLAR